MTSCKEVTKDQEIGGLTQGRHQLTVFPCGGYVYLTLLGLRHLMTKPGAIIPALAIAGSSESIWGMMAIVAVTWEAASEESWKGQGVGSVAPSVFGALVGSASWGGYKPMS